MSFISVRGQQSKALSARLLRRAPLLEGRAWCPPEVAGGRRKPDNGSRGASLIELSRGGGGGAPIGRPKCVLSSSLPFQNILLSIADAFLFHVNHFKLYSSFCASHSRAQKALHPNDGNRALQNFLASLNPEQQHSTALESYLIKPIQRILKYPLLLQQLRSAAPSGSGEHVHLGEALSGMERVAEHINEMQRIHEEYGAIFEHLFRQHQKASKQVKDDSPGH